MKRLLRFILTAMPACICMVLIFYFSSQTASDSSAASAGFIEWFLNAIFSKYEKISPAEQKNIIDSCQFIVRKAAHFSLYALLGILWYPPMYSVTNCRKKSAWIAWFVTVLYAVTDEIHQKFVPGRSGEFRDILIDCAGAAAGSLLVYAFVSKFILKQKKSGPPAKPEA